jgi:hypothetical protein
MLLRDQIFNHPLALLAGCVVWVPIAVWVVALLQWAIQGDVDVLSAFVGIVVGLALGLTAITAKEPYMPPLILAGVLVTTVAFPVVRSTLTKRALDQIDVEAVAKAYDQLRQQPTNAPAKFKLAKTIYNKGMPAHALALAEDAIKSMPEAIYPEENRILKTWRHYRIPANQRGPLACLECGVYNQPGMTHCQRCRAPFLLDHARGAWVGRSLARKFVAAWVSIMVSLVGIPYVAGAFPAAISIPAIIGLMGLAIFLIAVTFRSGAKKTA